MEKELEPIKDNNKYSLLENPAITSEQFKAIFSKTPKKHIHTRPGKGGQKFDYVTGVYVKKMLNYLTGWRWDFEIIDKGEVVVDGKIIQVWVQGKLTINNEKNEPIIIKTQFGGADVKYLKGKSNIPVDYANDLKAAATDALKKCASEIGIASDIYGKNEFKDIFETNKENDNEKLFNETIKLISKLEGEKRNTAIDRAIQSKRFNNEQENKLINLYFKDK